MEVTNGTIGVFPSRVPEHHGCRPAPRHPSKGIRHAPPSCAVRLASALVLTLSSATSAHAQENLGLNFKYTSTSTGDTVSASLPEQPPLNECLLIQQVVELEPGAPHADAFAPQNTSTSANAQIFAPDDCAGTPKVVLKPGSNPEPDDVTFRAVKFVLPD